MRSKIFLFVASLLILLVMIYYGCDRESEKELSDSLKFKEEYENVNGTKSSSGKVYPSIEIEEDNVIKYSNVSEIEEIVKSGTGVIYFGYPTCPWCRNAVPPLLQAASDAGIETIYYINLYEERDIYSVNESGELFLEKEGTSGYKKLLDLLAEHLDEYYIEDSDGNKIDTNEKRIYVPMVIFVRDGKIIGIHSDTVESQENPYVLLNDEQYEELYNIYSNYMHEVLNDLCDERC